MRSWPLRVKLVVLMLVLLAAALGTTTIASIYSTRDYLINRVDAQLVDSVDQETHGCEDPRTGRGPGGPVERNGYYVACVDEDGTVNESYNKTGTVNHPTLPKTLEDMTGSLLNQRTLGTYDTVDPIGGDGHQWRVLYAVEAPTRLGNGPLVQHDPVIIAISLDEVDATVGSQVRTSALIGGFVLLVLAVVAYLLVRSSLKPLVEVEETAEAIAAGDLSRRVPEADPRTEVGGLAQALNTMLGQIETAFEERRVSEESAVKSEERMRRFVADASHELRTPLTSIRGFAELDRQAGGQNEHLARIEHHATRMGLLVDDLLLLARMDQDRPLEKQPVDLLALATDALIDARVTSAGHRLRLRTASSEDDDADVEPAVVIGDEARLRQVLQNLLANARTHTPPGTEVTVFVGTEGNDAILEVADNGPGMPKEEAQRVFERFYRLEASRTRVVSGSGSGLGLSIVSALVAAHGGNVTLRTAPGEGAAFRVAIPLAR